MTSVDNATESCHSNAELLTQLRLHHTHETVVANALHTCTVRNHGYCWVASYPGLHEQSEMGQSQVLICVESAA